MASKALVTTLFFLTAGSVLWILVALLWFDLSGLPLTLTGCAIGSMYFGPCRLLPARMAIKTARDARHFVDEVN